MCFSLPAGGALAQQSWEGRVALPRRPEGREGGREPVMPTPEGQAPCTQGQTRADPEGAPGFKDHGSWRGWRPEAAGPTTRNQDVSLTQRRDPWKASSRE